MASRLRQPPERVSVRWLRSSKPALPRATEISRARSPSSSGAPGGCSGGERLDHHLLHRLPRREHRVLRHVADPRPLASDALAGVRLLAAGDDAQQRGLAGAVGADQAHVIAGGEGEAQPLEDGAATEGLGDVAEGDEGGGRHARRGNEGGRECTAPANRRGSRSTLRVGARSRMRENPEHRTSDRGPLASVAQLEKGDADGSKASRVRANGE